MTDYLFNIYLFFCSMRAAPRNKVCRQLPSYMAVGMPRMLMTLYAMQGHVVIGCPVWCVCQLLHV